MIKTTVRELGRVVTGHTPPTTKKEYYGDKYLFLKPTDMVIGQKHAYTTEEGYSELAATKYKSSLIPKGSTCVVCIGTLGEKMAMAHCDLFTNQSVNSIIPNDNYDPDYVYYLLKHNLHKVKALNKGTASGREFVSKTTFLDLEIEVIDNLNIQRKVSSILSSFDDLIENNRKQIKLLEEAAQWLYKEWFIDLHFPGYETTPIHDGIPEGWRKEGLGGLAPIITGKKDANFGTEDGVFPFFTCAQEPIKAPSYSFDCNAVILAGNGDFNVKIYRGKFEAYQRTYVLSPKDDKHLFLLFHAVRGNMMHLFKAASGSTIKFLTKGMLENIPVFVPSEDILNMYYAICEAIQCSIECLKQQISYSQEARNRLLPKLMNGEMEV